MWPFKRKAESVPRPRYPRGISMRNYLAAEHSRLVQSWTAAPRSADQLIRQGARILRARSREQYANNDYARRFVGMVVSHVVGPNGVGMQSRVTSNRGNPDNGANEGIELAWRTWGRREHCDYLGRLSWREMQRLFMTTVAMDGEAIVIKRSGSGSRYGFQLRMVDPELLPVEYDRPEEGIRFGIEYDDDGRPIAYHFRTLSEDGAYTWGNRKYVRVPAASVIHCFVPEYVDQRRGLPWMSTSLMRMHMLGAYEQAAITNARVGASKMGFFTSPDGQSVTGDDTDAHGNLLTGAEPGTFEQLPDGVEFQAFNPDYPNGEFGDFVKACLRGIASGLGVSYHGLSGDLEGVNFSSIRSGVLEEREVWKGLQEWLVDNFCQPVFEEWLQRALMAGAVKTPSGGTLAALQFDKYNRAAWQPRRWSWVDPLKDMQANTAALDAGLRSRSDIIREMGRDPEEVWREIQRERELMELLGVSGQPAAPATEEESDDEQDDEQDDENNTPE